MITSLTSLLDYFQVLLSANRCVTREGYRNSPHIYSDMNSFGSFLKGGRFSHSIRSLAHLAESCSSNATPSVTCIASALVQTSASSRPPLACLHERNFVFDRVIAHLTIGSPWPWQATSVRARPEPERQQEGAFSRYLAWAATAFAAGAATAAWQLPTVHCDALQPTVSMDPFNITDIHAMKHIVAGHIHTHPDASSLIIFSGTSHHQLSL